MAAEPVVDRKTELDHPWRPLLVRYRQDEPHRPNDMGRDPQQHVALDQCLVYEPKRAVLEVAQAAMNELGRGRGRSGGKVVLLDQQDLEPPTGSVARNTGAVDSAANDGKIEVSYGCLRDHAAAPWRASVVRSRSLCKHVR